MIERDEPRPGIMTETILAKPVPRRRVLGDGNQRRAWQDRGLTLWILGSVLLCLSATTSAQSDDPEDLLRRAELAYSQGDYSGAVAIWQPMAETGNAQAQFALGNAYERGHGLPPDMESAANWYRRAAQSGLAVAQYNLANLYLNGDGVREDPVTAIGLFRRAAEQGFVAAQFNLAYAYDSGTGVDEDRAVAATWYARAAIGGSGDAMQRLSELRREGVTPAALPALARTRPAPAPTPTPTTSAEPGSGQSAGELEPAAGPATEDAAEGWYLRLAAYRSEAAAERGWGVLIDRHPAVLKPLQHRLQAIDLGAERGRFLRLLAGPVADQQTATRRCRSIIAADGDCIPQLLSRDR